MNLPYTSRVAADFTATVIVRGAGVLTAGSMLIAFLPGAASKDSSWTEQWLPMTLMAAFGAALFFYGPKLLVTTAAVGTDEIVLSSAGIKKRFAVSEVTSVSSSNFPSGGYGFRYLGKVHRGFISGGPQVGIVLTDGREFTVSVDSEVDFCAAVEQAMAKLAGARVVESNS